MDISQIKFIKAKIALLDEEKNQLIIKLKSTEETNSQARISSPLYTTSRPIFLKENISVQYTKIDSGCKEVFPEENLSVCR